MRVILATIILMAMSSCASDMAWEYPAGQQQAFYRDRAQCQAMANGGGSNQIQEPNNGGFVGGYNLGSAIRHNRESDQIFSDCMRGHGYRLVRR